MAIYVQPPSSHPNIDKNGVATLALTRVCQIVKVSPTLSYAYRGERWIIKGAGARGQGKVLSDAIGSFIKDVLRVKQLTLDDITEQFTNH